MVTSDGALLVFVELALDEAQDEARLADGRLAEQDQFELADLALRRAVGPLRRAGRRRRTGAAARSPAIRHRSPVDVAPRASGESFHFLRFDTTPKVTTFDSQSHYQSGTRHSNQSPSNFTTQRPNSYGQIISRFKI